MGRPLGAPLFGGAPLFEGGAALLLLAGAAAPLASLLVHIDAAALAPLWSARTYALLGRSLLLAAAVTLGALAIGVPLGTVFARRRRAAGPASVLLALHAAPLFVPPFLLGLGWFALLGRDGYIGSPASASLLFSSAGCTLVLALTFAPLVSALTALGMRNVDAALIEAARVVAPPRSVVWRVALPAAWPSVAGAALIVFALALAEMALPQLLRVAVYPSAVFARVGGVTQLPGEAAALSLPLLVVGLALLALERRVLWRRGRVFDVLGGARSRSPLADDERSLAGVAAMTVGAALSLAPFAALLARARFAGVGAWLASSVQNSLVVSVSAASAITAFGVVAGHAAARGRRSGRALDGGALLAFLVPAAALGVGISALYSRPATSALYHSLGIVVLGLFARYAIVGARVFGSAVAQSSRAGEDAAAVAGARFASRLWHVVLPTQRRALGASWLGAVVFCLRDVETTILFYPPGGATLPVRIFTLEANGPAPLVAALSLTHVALTLAVVLAGAALLSAYARVRPLAPARSP
ncbi:MAG: iron ABC transporter permease [Myxococcales bacterium]|nr:iron ABC transporter permease [Myxococcales bacterium]